MTIMTAQSKPAAPAITMLNCLPKAAFAMARGSYADEVHVVGVKPKTLTEPVKVGSSVTVAWCAPVRCMPTMARSTVTTCSFSPLDPQASTRPRVFLRRDWCRRLISRRCLCRHKFRHSQGRGVRRADDGVRNSRGDNLELVVSRRCGRAFIRGGVGGRGVRYAIGLRPGFARTFRDSDDGRGVG